jgi:hypothetical protein
MCAKNKSNLRMAAKLAATRSRVIVKFWSPFEEGSTEGYVLDIGPEFFLLLLVDDKMRFNGFQCLHLQDVRKLQVPAKYAAFVEAALRIRGERVEKKPRVRLDNIEELLLTANRIFPVVAIHRERVNPDVCHIGRVVKIEKGSVFLEEIGPDAKWDDQPTDYRLREITRVDFGGGYEEALVLVGGVPAGAKSRRRLPKPE